jgi:hypothetical protein
MRNDIVVAFLAILFLAFIIFMFRFVFRAGADWSEYILEWVGRKKPAARLLSEMDNRPRERLVEIALALALAPYHWPKRRSGNDEGLVRARQRYMEFLASLSDDDLRQWIKDKIQDTHSLLLKVALESSNDKGSSGRKKD